MKRFIVVACDGYYPDWMLGNIRGHFEYKFEAEEFRNYILDNHIYEAAEVVDTDYYEPDDHLFLQYKRERNTARVTHEVSLSS